MDKHDFDVAVTFAGEDRTFVDEVVAIVKEAGFTVFYDEDAKIEMWGEDLTEYFPDVYERRARFAVMFVSAHYALKPWIRLERRSVLCWFARSKVRRRISYPCAWTRRSYQASEALSPTLMVKRKELW